MLPKKNLKVCKRNRTKMFKKSFKIFQTLKKKSKIIKREEDRKKK